VRTGPAAGASLLALSLALGAAATRAETAEGSACYGTSAKGRLERGAVLSPSGPEFGVYSLAAVALGRTCVHSTVAEIARAAYADLAAERPDTVYLLGETGWCRGGSFAPHKTHQNGTSVDFMVPVVDAAGKSVPLPTHALNRFGYDVEFDAAGRYEDLRIDYAAVAAHLAALRKQAAARGIAIRRVIFAPELRKHVSAPVPWSEKRPWVRHDEHYHVDFAVPCEPL
jgi:penicillin-insensitive murein endopeptidase